jgi:hypothetical protein
VSGADNLSTFKCRLSRNLGASTSWNPKGLSRPVMGHLYLYLSFSAFSSMFTHAICTVILCVIYTVCAGTRVGTALKYTIECMQIYLRLYVIYSHPIFPFYAKPAFSYHSHHIHATNCTIIRYNNIHACGNPHSCFGLFRPPSGRHSTKENTILPIYVPNVQW